MTHHDDSTRLARALPASLLTILAFLGSGCACSGDLDLGSSRDGGQGSDGAAPFHRTDQCGNGLDDDRNGRIDDGCPCAPGETQACFSGPVEARLAGACTDGVQTCAVAGTTEWGDWGDSPCEGDTAPVEELCDGRDHDCDGTRDEGCPCTAGDTRECGVEFLRPPCSGGEQACAPDGTWSGCEGAVRPEPDVCGDGIDNDCDGSADVGCDCVPRPELCRDGIDNDCDGSIDEAACMPDWPPDGGAPVPDGGLPACDDTLAPIGPDWAVPLSVVAARDGTTTFGGSIDPSAIEVDAAGTLFVAGSLCEGSVTIGGTTISYGPALPYPTHTCNSWVASLTPAGAIRWAWAPRLEALPGVARPGDENSAFRIAGLAADGRGGVWFVGRFHGRLVPGGGLGAVEEPGTVFGGDAVLGRVDATGALVDFHVYGEWSTPEAFEDVVLAPGGDPVVLGTSNTVFDLGGTLVRTMNGRFLARLDAGTGVASWVKTLRPAEPSSTMYEATLTMDATGRLLVVGGSNGPWDFPDRALASTDRDRGHTFLWTAVPADGSTVALESWQASAGYYAHGLDGARDARGAVLFGKLRGTIDFGSGPLVSGGSTSESPFGSYLQAFDATAATAGHAFAFATVYEYVHLAPTWSDDLDTVALVASSATAPRSTRSDVATDLGDGPRNFREGRLYLARWDRDAVLLEVRDHSAIEGADGDGDLRPRQTAHAPCERAIYGTLGRSGDAAMVIRRVGY